MSLGIPEALKLEHQALHAELVALTASSMWSSAAGNRVGRSAPVTGANRR